jgi:hypothetical protein
VDKYLCCACNHILHTAWVEHDGANSEGEHLPDELADDMSLAEAQLLKQALKPKACPDHMDFLGKDKPQRLVLRYTHEEISALMQELECLWPLALARAPPDHQRASWDLRGLTGQYLGVSIPLPQPYLHHFGAQGGGGRGEGGGGRVRKGGADRLGGAGRVDVTPLGNGGSGGTGDQVTVTVQRLVAHPRPTSLKCMACRARSAHASEEEDDVPLSQRSPVKTGCPSGECACTCQRLHDDDVPLAQRSVSRVERKCEWVKKRPERTEETRCDAGSTVLLRGPLFGSEVFPPLKWLLGGAQHNQRMLHADGAPAWCLVTPEAFRKHLLRLNPHLKRLLPAHARADAEDGHSGDAEGRDGGVVTPQESGGAQAHVRKKHRSEERKKREGDGDRDTEAEVEAEAEEMELRLVAERIVMDLADPEVKEEEEEDGDDDDDDDVPLIHRLQEYVKLRETSQATGKLQARDTPQACATPPRLPGAAKPLLKSPAAISGIHHHGPGLDLHRAPPASKHCCHAQDATPSSDAGRSEPNADVSYRVSYGRKRWKVVRLYEFLRSDASLALTLRLRRKRKRPTAVPAS